MASTVPVTPRRTSERWLEDPDVRLMLKARDGDSSSFAELARRYGRRVLGYFRRHLGDRMEAEDLTQEVFLRLYRYRQRYQPHAQFSTWVFFIAQRPPQRPPLASPPSRRAAERSVQRAAIAAGGAGVRPLHFALRGPGAERTCRRGPHRRGRAGRAQQTALELHQFQNHSYAEVAEALNTTPKAAKSLLYRARLELREVLEGYVE